ncbi:hypothetical protein Adt_42848 [Abeliophyllum distichum]|uniref:Uncharacterized protein n=1 Tax=Abeliophyllum distichum TaxID=126358 RepID=A0ABD1PST9_9LAMI
MDDSVKTTQWFSFMQPLAQRNSPPPPIFVVGVGVPLPVNQPTDNQIFTDIVSFTSLMPTLGDLENMLGFNMVGVSTSLDRLQQKEQAPITENPSPAIMCPLLRVGILIKRFISLGSRRIIE